MSYMFPEQASYYQPVQHSDWEMYQRIMCTLQIRWKYAIGNFLLSYCNWWYLVLLTATVEPGLSFEKCRNYQVTGKHTLDGSEDYLLLENASLLNMGSSVKGPSFIRMFWQFVVFISDSYSSGIDCSIHWNSFSSASHTLSSCHTVSMQPWGRVSFRPQSHRKRHLGCHGKRGSYRGGYCDASADTYL